MESAEIAAAAREIDRQIDEVARSSASRVYITQNTRETGYAMYYKSVGRKLESEASTHFPTKNGKKLYGSLIVVIPIARDGTLLSGTQAPSVGQSSNNADLDAAALAFIQHSAPFPPLPTEFLRDGYYDVWVIIAALNFTRIDHAEKVNAESHP